MFPDLPNTLVHTNTHKWFYEFFLTMRSMGSIEASVVQFKFDRVSLCKGHTLFKG